MPRKKEQDDLSGTPVMDKFTAYLQSGGATAPERETISWADVDGATLLDAIAAATEAGAGLLLSKTSDGGALTLILFWKSAKHKWFPVDADRAADLLTTITAAAQAATS